MNSGKRSFTLPTIGAIILSFILLFLITKQSLSHNPLPPIPDLSLGSTTATEEANVFGSVDTNSNDALSTSTDSEIIQSSDNGFEKTPISDYSFTEPNLKIYTSNGVIKAFVAKNPSTREQGLGKRLSLGVNQGMFFIFPKPDKYDFWMKDMNFPIDVVWINQDRVIVGITPNLSPASYPASFASPGPVQFVLELNANTATDFGFKVGSRVIF